MQKTSPGRMVRRALALLAVYVLATAGASAQSTFASIVGTVHDASGALLVGAQVTLTDAGTNSQRNAVTDSAGNYAFANIEPGLYQVSIAAAGFSRSRSPPFP